MSNVEFPLPSNLKKTKPATAVSGGALVVGVMLNNGSILSVAAQITSLFAGLQ